MPVPVSISDALISRDIDFHIVRPSIVGAAAAVYSSCTAAAAALFDASSRAGPGCPQHLLGAGGRRRPAIKSRDHKTTRVVRYIRRHTHTRAQAHIRMVVNKAAGLYDKRTDIYSHIS